MVPGTLFSESGTLFPESRATVPYQQSPVCEKITVGSKEVGPNAVSRNFQ